MGDRRDRARTGCTPYPTPCIQHYGSPFPLTLLLLLLPLSSKWGPQVEGYGPYLKDSVMLQHYGRPHGLTPRPSWFCDVTEKLWGGLCDPVRGRCGRSV